MDNAKLKWLLKCADKLRDSQPDLLDVATLLTQLGVEFRTVTGREGYGELRISEERKFQIIIKTATGQLIWNRRERFAAAHELGHLLLLQKWNYRPRRSDEREYFLCERMCNRFAGRLLINPRAVYEIDYDTPESCLNGVLELAKRYQVSLQAAAKELAMTRSGIAVCYVLTGKKMISWGVSSIGSFKETRNRLFEKAFNGDDLPVDLKASQACTFWLSERLPELPLRENVTTGKLQLREAELVSIITKRTPAILRQQAFSGRSSALASNASEA